MCRPTLRDPPAGYPSSSSYRAENPDSAFDIVGNQIPGPRTGSVNVCGWASRLVVEKGLRVDLPLPSLTGRGETGEEQGLRHGTAATGSRPMTRGIRKPAKPDLLVSFMRCLTRGVPFALPRCLSPGIQPGLLPPLFTCARARRTSAWLRLARCPVPNETGENWTAARVLKTGDSHCPLSRAWLSSCSFSFSPSATLVPRQRGRCRTTQRSVSDAMETFRARRLRLRRFQSSGILEIFEID